MNQFSIDYPEYHIAGLLQKDFPKQDNYSVSIPLSRQQKHYDLLLLNGNKKKFLTIQVKSSRTYINTDADTSVDFNYYAWLNSFKTVDNYSDYYFIFISFPIFDTKTFRPRTAFGTKILVFDSKEMSTLLTNIKRTKKGTPDKFFSFAFNIEENRIFGDRGFNKNPRIEFTDKLYENKLQTIKNSI
ncbi:MAG: hypothetical protein M9940_09485 [Bacteroidetes bacterium]|nr:hypothetical protein [Bacteroidota bacterium]